MNVNAQFLGSTRVSRVGFGVAPKQALLLRCRIVRVKSREEVRDREGALASTRDARAPQKTL